jgi:hypothetical protein
VNSFVTIAYWDTQQPGQRPRLLGEIQGTPTLRLYKPKKKQRDPTSNKEKVVVDYQHGERTAKDMKRFLEAQMPSFVERIKFGDDDLRKVYRKSVDYDNLPVAMFFTSKTTTSPLLKYLSTEFRRRLLVVEILPVASNQQLRRQHEVDNESSSKLLIVDTKTNTTTPYGDTKFTKHKVTDFLKKHALKEPVYTKTTNTTSHQQQQQQQQHGNERQQPHDEF